MRNVMFLLCSIPTAIFHNVEGAASCSGDQVPVQKLDVSLKSNGCTKPDFLSIQGEEDFTHCCDLHDACFSTCGLTQSFCDDDFKKCMHQLCSKVFSHNPECKSAASTYSMGTSLFGRDLFAQGQEEYCECVDSKDLISHYMSYTKQFYQDNVPSDLTKDPEDILSDNSKYLKTSVKSSVVTYPNLRRLVYDLHKKYDNAIVHIENRKGRKNVPKPVKKEL